MQKPGINKIVVLGGGTAGWMAAAALSKALGTRLYDITVVESEEIGTVGVGEATIPMILLYNQFLGIDENTFVKATNATFKLGIEFVDWKRVGESYIHPFGSYGLDQNGIEFSHFWYRLASRGGSIDFGRFNAETMAARANRFDRVQPNDRPGLPGINYAFQFDAALYAGFLRGYAEERGVVRKEGKVVNVQQDAESGYIRALDLADGTQVQGDFFIDCSGFRGLLIEETLKAGYIDWSQWLPCNRAVAVPTDKALGPLVPYTRAIAQEAGWQWRIPLQHRTGNGYVFCDAFITEAEATDRLMTRLDAKPIRDPKVLRFVTGLRRKMWDKNVVALGLANGFLEPLESTAIYLVQAAISKLLGVFPRDEVAAGVPEQFNREMHAEYENIKDFLVAHYYVTEREDTPFWRRNRTMAIPDSLRERLDIYKSTGNSSHRQGELFKEASWFAVLLGQGLFPKAYHPIADTVGEDELRLTLSKLRTNVMDRVQTLPSHDEFIRKHCDAGAGLKTAS